MYYGIDIGGTKTAFAVFNEQENELSRAVQPTPHQNYEALLSLIIKWVEAADFEWKTTGQVGIGFPGTVDKQGCLMALNVPALHGQPLIADLAQRLARPVFADNDANCFLLSEYQGGAVAHRHWCLGVTLGTGVGGALLHRGVLITGKNGGAGEFGHGAIHPMVLARYPELPLLSCGCGLQGCLEAYVSGTGLERLYQHQSTQPLSAPAVITAWHAGEMAATTSVNWYLEVLAAGIANLMTQLDPEVVVLGGGVSEQAWLYEQLNTRLPHYLMRHQAPALVVAPLFGGTGGVRGAALLAKHRTSPFS